MKSPSVDEVMQQAASAFKIYSRLDAEFRQKLLADIAGKLNDNEDALISLAETETHLTKPRLRTELHRTVFQLKNYGDAAASGFISGLRKSKSADGTDIRKMNIPIGPVVVFGASNFPFAYSTAGGDTASALAAGCSVIVKGHPAHMNTSRTIANLISETIKETNLPEGVFNHVEEFEAGEALVKHPLTKAVAFTGSNSGGRQLFDWGNERSVPIPVFAEMGSVNPVYIFPGFSADPGKISKRLADSITTGAGQFCTKPGLLIAVNDEYLENFLELLAHHINKAAPHIMLHKGIHESFIDKRDKLLAQEGVGLMTQSSNHAGNQEGIPSLAECSARTFISNPLLHQEIFGPLSLVIKCESSEEMSAVAESIEGQLTSTIWCSENEILNHRELIEQISEKCGRLILNGVPTGVTVCDAMHHGGPYPASTDSRFTSVGADAMLRFLRPIAYQGWPEEYFKYVEKN